MHCFERASQDRQVAVCRAYYLREQARITNTRNSRQSIATHQKAFLVAAEAFNECASVASQEKTAYYMNAGNCFEHGGEDRKAAQAYLNAEEFTLAAKLYRKSGLFDEAVDVVQSHKDQIPQDVVDGIIGVARLFYFKSSQDDDLKYVFFF